MRYFVIANTVILMAALWAWSLGYSDELGLLAGLASVMLLISAILYVTVRDPLEKWPGLRWFQRLGRLFR